MPIKLTPVISRIPFSDSWYMRCLGSRTGGNARAAFELASSCTSCDTTAWRRAGNDESCGGKTESPVGTPKRVWAGQKARNGARGAAMWGSSDTSWERGCWHAPAKSPPAVPRLLRKLQIAYNTESCDAVSGCKSSTQMALLVSVCKGQGARPGSLPLLHTTH